MTKQENFFENVLKFNDDLTKAKFNLPKNYKIINPLKEGNKEKVKEVMQLFYKKYYNDNKKRFLVLGSSPARKGTAITGIPFEDAKHLYEITGITIDDFYINKSSSGFLYEVMEKYGGIDKFYKDFFLNFVCPLGITKINTNGKEINCNYYENKEIESALYEFIVDSLRKLISLGIDTSICYCIGSGENFKFLTKINEKYNFFGKIIPLEHPRFIMQYNSKAKENYINKYLDALNSANN